MSRLRLPLDPDCRDARGGDCTPLQVAASVGHLDAVRLLLEAGLRQSQFSGHLPLNALTKRSKATVIASFFRGT